MNATCIMKFIIHFIVLQCAAAGALALGIHVVKAGRALLGDAARPDLRLRLGGLRGRQRGRHGDAEPANDTRTSDRNSSRNTLARYYCYSWTRTCQE